jgi:hypothetical protein
MWRRMYENNVEKEITQQKPTDNSMWWFDISTLWLLSTGLLTRPHTSLNDHKKLWLSLCEWTRLWLVIQVGQVY